MSRAIFARLFFEYISSETILRGPSPASSVNGSFVYELFTKLLFEV